MNIPTKIPDPCTRLQFPVDGLARGGVCNDTLFLGCCVAMEERGEDGLLLTRDRLRVIYGKSVKVTLKG